MGHERLVPVESGASTGSAGVVLAQDRLLPLGLLWATFSLKEGCAGGAQW